MWCGCGSCSGLWWFAALGNWATFVWCDDGWMISFWTFKFTKIAALVLVADAGI
jgi:hypothetical protein